MLLRFFPLAAALLVAGCLSGRSPDAPIDISTKIAAMTDNRGMIIASMPDPAGSVYVVRVEKGDTVSAEKYGAPKGFFNQGPGFEPVYVMDAGNYEIVGLGYRDGSSYGFDKGFFHSDLNEMKQRLNSPRFTLAPGEIKHIGFIEVVKIPGTYNWFKGGSQYRMAIRDLTEAEKVSVRRRYPTISDRIKFEKAKDSVMSEIVCKLKDAGDKAKADLGAKAASGRNMPLETKPLLPSAAKAQALIAQMCGPQ